MRTTNGHLSGILRIKTAALPLTLRLFLAIAGVATSSEVNAWFFFFVPGSVIDKVGDTLTGAEGENCVTATTKVGDRITAPSGNIAVVKSVSGSSDRCKNPNLPIRAKLEFERSFSSSAGLELPDSFKPKEITATQRFQGMVLSATEAQRSIGVVIHSRPRKGNADGAAIAKSVSDTMLTLIEGGKVSNAEELTINGMKAYRFQVVGKNKGIFGQSFTYVVTVLESENEIVVVNTNCKTDDFEQHAGYLKRVAYEVQGLSVKPSQTAVTQPVASPTQPEQQATIRAPQEISSESSATVRPNSALPPPPANSSETIADRLRTLDKLLKEGLITPADYDAKKLEILKAL